ncbi:hypothetical protein [Halorubrum salinum]|nr:hypothetical protein [Halorubrum salinum]
MPGLAVAPDMTTPFAELAASTPLQAGILASPTGQLLAALVAAAIVIVLGKFVLKLAWRLVTIGIVVVAAAYLLTVLGII